MYNDCTATGAHATRAQCRVQACFHAKAPGGLGAEDGRVQVERLPTVRWAATSQAGWAAAAVRGAQQAALSPMLKRREQMPLTEGRSSGGMREKPSRLYGAKTCSSSSMSAGSPSTVASSDASSPAPWLGLGLGLGDQQACGSARWSAVDQGKAWSRGRGQGLRREDGAWRWSLDVCLCLLLRLATARR